MSATILAVLLVASPLDSQVVLQHYASALASLVAPKAMIFDYSVSQAGPTNIDQHHRVYRRGIDVRDETLEVDGTPLRRKSVRITRRPDPYAVAALAPRLGEYELLFLNTVADGDHLDYIYEATPLYRNGGFTVDRITIDGQHFLPRRIDFHTSGALASGSGSIEFGPEGGYWVALAATVSAVVTGGVARERILFSEYRFPPALPKSTFL